MLKRKHGTIVLPVLALCMGSLSAVAGLVDDVATADLPSFSQKLNSDQKEDQGTLNKALHRACEIGRVEAVIQLLNKGAEVDANIGGERPLHKAAQNGHISVVEILIAWARKQGKDMTTFMNAPNNSGGTALHSTAIFGFNRLTRILCDNGARAGVRTHGNDPLTPLQYAKTYGNQTSVMILTNVCNQ
ncbi:MAG: ankyrin repeat domain-containing protein [Myxococcota bacterium]